MESSEEKKAAAEEEKDWRYWLLFTGLLITVVVVVVSRWQEGCESECKKSTREQLREMGVAPVKANKELFDAQMAFCMPICERQRARARALKASGGDEPL